jgi:hypothetical protein
MIEKLKELSELKTKEVLAIQPKNHTTLDEILKLSEDIEAINKVISILNGDTEKREIKLFCPQCGKRYRMQGNGIIELLCECDA